MIEVRMANNPKNITRFVSFPRELHRNCSQWVEPLRSEQLAFLDKARHPFYANGSRAEFFIAVDPIGERILGRIAAIINYSQKSEDGNGKKKGHFGFFESIDSQEVAKELLDAATNWLRMQGVELVLGPATPSQHYEYGLLVEGFEQTHRFLLPYS